MAAHAPIIVINDPEEVIVIGDEESEAMENIAVADQEIEVIVVQDDDEVDVGLLPAINPPALPVDEGLVPDDGLVPQPNPATLPDDESGDDSDGESDGDGDNGDGDDDFAAEGEDDTDGDSDEDFDNDLKDVIDGFADEVDEVDRQAPARFRAAVRDMRRVLREWSNESPDASSGNSKLYQQARTVDSWVDRIWGGYDDEMEEVRANGWIVPSRVLRAYNPVRADWARLCHGL